MKSIWQIELAEEENFRIQHDEMTARTSGWSKIQDIAFKSRENNHDEFFPIGSRIHFEGSLIVLLKKMSSFFSTIRRCLKSPPCESPFVIPAQAHWRQLNGHERGDCPPPAMQIPHNPLLRRGEEDFHGNPPL
jgi:hypothetical protein